MEKMYLNRFFFIFLFTKLSLVQAQQVPQVFVQPDTTTIRIGEQIRLSVKVLTDTLSFVDFPEISELGEMEVVTSSTVDTIEKYPIRKLKKDYFLTQWDSGVYKTTPILLKINDSIFPTDSLQIKVLPVKVDTTQQGLYPYKPPVNVKGEEVLNKRKTPVWWWLLLLPVVLLIAYYFYNKRKRKEEQKKSLTSYQKIQNILSKLEKDKLWLRNQTDEHYFQLTNALKNYLEEELGISVKEKISSELLLNLRKFKFEDGTYFPSDLLNRLEEMLKRADLAKFAKLFPYTDKIDLDISIVRDIVEKSHQTITAIEEAKLQEQLQKQMEKRRKKRIIAIVVGSIILLLLVLGSVTYYYLNKNQLSKNLIENASKPEWIYSEYGSSPALALTTPHILHPVDISMQLDSLPQIITQQFDEISVYQDVNPVKKYMILVGSIDTKQETTDKLPIDEIIITMILKQLQAHDVNLQQADVNDSKRYFGDFVADIPVIGQNVKVVFDSRFYQKNQTVKFVVGFYLQGNRDNKELIDKVLQSSELVP